MHRPSVLASAAAVVMMLTADATVTVARRQRETFTGMVARMAGPSATPGSSSRTASA